MNTRWNIGGTCFGFVTLALLVFPVFGTELSSTMAVSTVSRGGTSPGLTETAKLPEMLDRLRQVENRVLPSVLVPGPNAHATLPEYYWAENQDLLARFDEAKRAYAKPTKAPYRSVTLVAGSAGVGKTFLKSEVYGDVAPKEAVCKFDIHDLYDQWTTQGLIFDRPDIACDGAAVSHCTSLRERQAPLLREYLEAQNASFYVIDSLDEVHPEDCRWVLGQVDEFVFQGDRDFVAVAVFGRSHAFRDFWTARRELGHETNARLLLLNPPAFRTTGDLLVSTWNYHTWKYGLKWSPQGGEPEPMSLDAYRDWVSDGYSHTGRFESITCRENDDMRSDVQDRLVGCAGQRPAIGAMLYNLAGNGIIREILQTDLLAGKPYDEQEVMSAYFDQWLIRETKAHGTPSLEAPTRLDLYMTLLQRLAVMYADDVDDSGFFTVRDEDRVEVRYSGRQLAFPVKPVLNRSGLTLSDPRKEGEEEYRFEPFWLHRMLVKEHQERLSIQ